MNGLTRSFALPRLRPVEARARRSISAPSRRVAVSHRARRSESCRHERCSDAGDVCGTVVGASKRSEEGLQH